MHAIPCFFLRFSSLETRALATACAGDDPRLVAATETILVRETLQRDRRAHRQYMHFAKRHFEGLNDLNLPGLLKYAGFDAVHSAVLAVGATVENLQY